MIRSIALATSLALAAPAALNQCDHEAAPVKGRCTQWEAKLAEYPDWDVARMSRIMHRESRCQPGAISRTSDYGLLQVHVNRATFEVAMRTGFDSLAYECEISEAHDLLDADKGIECAHDLFRAFGYRPWGG
jgi:hypothetical protein